MNANRFCYKTTKGDMCLQCASDPVNKYVLLLILNWSGLALYNKDVFITCFVPMLCVFVWLFCKPRLFCVASLDIHSSGYSEQCDYKLCMQQWF